MIISRSTVYNDRTENIERSVITEFLFFFHVHFDFVQRNVSGTFNHYLNIRFAAASNQFAEDFTKLLAGDVFSEEPLGASVEMKFSLDNSPLVDQVPEGIGREIARRIYQRFDFFQGVDAAFIELSEGGVKIFFILTEDDIDLYDSLYDFEEQLVEDFGRNTLAVFSFTPDLLDAMPPLDQAYRIFDRRQERRQLG